MNIKDAKESKYISKKELALPITATIASCEMEAIQMEGNQSQNKAVMRFREPIKPWIVGTQTLEVIGSWWGEETERWVGKRIELYHDANITFKGKVTGGTRARLPQGQQAGGNGTPQYPTLGDVFVACEITGVAKETMIAEFKARGIKSYIAAQHSALVQSVLDAAGALPAENLPGEEQAPKGDRIPF